MIKKTSILIGLLSSSVLCQAQADDKNNDKAVKPAAVELNVAQKKAKALNEKFGNLPKEDRIKYLQLRAKAHQLFSKKRTFEALIVIYDMRMIFKDDPAVLNLLGAISVEFRDFKYARSVFREAIELSGEDPKLLFNMAELAFCDNDWKTCLKEMDYIIKKLGDTEKKAKEAAIAAGLEPSKGTYTDSDFVRIMIFKQMLCHLALAQDKGQPDAERVAHEEQAIEIAGRFDYMVDSPYHYYAQAALAYHRDEKTDAAIWIMSGKKVFSNNQAATTSWDDTLVEFGYIESHYGRHFKEDALIEDVE